MFKKVMVLFLMLLHVSIFASDEVVIKAKGEFAKELKELLEKYEKEGIENGSIEILDEKTLQEQKSPIEQAIQEQIKIDSKNPTQQTKKDIYNQFFSDDPDVKKEYGNIAEGKAIYEKSCYKCHGDKADKNSYSAPRILKNLPRDEIVYQLKNYNRDSSYGKSTGLVMRAQATMLSESQMKSIAAYIETLKNKD